MRFCSRDSASGRRVWGVFPLYRYKNVETYGMMHTNTYANPSTQGTRGCYTGAVSSLMIYCSLIGLEFTERVSTGFNVDRN